MLKTVEKESEKESDLSDGVYSDVDSEDFEVYDSIIKEAMKHPKWQDFVSEVAQGDEEIEQIYTEFESIAEGDLEADTETWLHFLWKTNTARTPGSIVDKFSRSIQRRVPPHVALHSKLPEFIALFREENSRFPFSVVASVKNDVTLFNDWLLATGTPKAKDIFAEPRIDAKVLSLELYFFKT